MKRPLLFLSIIVLLLITVGSRSLYKVKAETTSDIVVDGADSTWRSSITASSGLESNIEAIQSSFVTQYTNATLQYHLSIIPSSLQTQINGLVLPVVSDFADAVSYEHLITVPENLQSLLTKMLTSVETQFANSSYYSMLRFPLALMEDTTAPIIDNVSAQSTFTDTVLTWSTDEFAHCTVNYGTQPGDYEQTINNSLYYQNHGLRVNNITQGATYFVQLVCTDQSGNISISSEYSFVVLEEQRIWLPLIQR